jgi:uncharacterized protein YPO0396
VISEIWRIAKTLVTLTDDLQRYHSEIKEIRQELRDLTIIVHALAQENKHTKEQLSLAHEKYLLEVENKLQSLNKRLPSKSSSKKKSSKKK